MINLKNIMKPNAIDAAIDEALLQLKKVKVETDEYAQMVDQITELYKLKEKHSNKRVSPDTLAIIVGNLVGIALIIGHEHTHVITSKALGFVIRPK